MAISIWQREARANYSGQIPSSIVELREYFAMAERRNFGGPLAGE